MNSRTVKIAVLPIMVILALSASLLPNRQDGAEIATSGYDAGEAPVQVAYAQQEEDEPDAGERYLLKAYGGYIAVYTSDSSEPYIITDIALSHLRESDRRMVELGMEVETREELLSLLEDFGY